MTIPTTLPITEILLLCAISLMVALSLLDKDKTKTKILNNQLTLSRAYIEAMILLWLPIIFLGIHVYSSPLTLSAIGLHWNNQWQTSLSSFLLLAIIAYFVASSLSLKKDIKSQQTLAEQMLSLSWFMPKTKNQISLFTCGLSVSAGICEELIFRGYLLHLLSDHIGLTLSVLISSAIFGLCHLYQGAVHVFRTFIIGLVFCLVYLASDTLIIPIILHIAIDVYGGVTGYYSRNAIKALSLKSATA